MSDFYYIVDTEAEYVTAVFESDMRRLSMEAMQDLGRWLNATGDVFMSASPMTPDHTMYQFGAEDAEATSDWLDRREARK